MKTIEVIKDTDFSEEFPIGISILNKNSIHYISEEHAKELYKKLGEVLGMNKVDEEKLADLELEAAEKRRTWAIGHYKELGIPMPSSFSLSDIDEAYMGGYDSGYRKAKEE